MTIKPNAKFSFFKVLLSVVLAFVAISWIVAWLFKFKYSESGPFGDTFGAVNALFSALAFAFLIVTLKMQKEELELQREELKLTREEMKKGRKEQSSQTREMERQNRFLMVSAQTQIINNILPIKLGRASSLRHEAGKVEHEINLVEDYYQSSIWAANSGSLDALIGRLPANRERLAFYKDELSTLENYIEELENTLHNLYKELSELMVSTSLKETLKPAHRIN